MTKELRIVVVVIVTLAMVLTVALTGNVQAKKHHQDIPCTFSHKNDECFGHDTSNFPKLPRGQHYGQCEEIGDNNELGCDIVNDGEG